MATVTASTNRFAFSSSIAGDNWHPQKDPKAYEWWYFDALSDDHDEAIVVVFLDNFIYSPRYNHGKDERHPLSLYTERFPAVSFAYFKDGKQLYRAESEFAEDEFLASEQTPECNIGGSGFRFDSAPYGSGYLLSVDLPLSRHRRLRAELEWLSIESDLIPAPPCLTETSHSWNMVAPRCDVSGRIEVTNARGETLDTRTFRGTGYHDHNLDNRWLATTVKEWHWGRAHFTDSTAVFCRYHEVGGAGSETKLMIVKDGELEIIPVTCMEQDFVRDRFGIRYPTLLSLVGDDGLSFETRPLGVIDSSFYHLRFLSSIVMTCPGDRRHETTGITEFIAPQALRYRWLNWLSDLRTGRNGRGPLI